MMLDELQQRLIAEADKRNAKIVGPLFRRHKDLRISVACRAHGTFAAAVDLKRATFRHWCWFCGHERASEAQRRRTLIRLKAYAVSYGGAVLADRIPPASTHVDAICLRHGPFRLCLKAGTGGKRAWCAKCKFQKLRELHRLPYGEVVRVVAASEYTLVTSETHYKNAGSIVVKCKNGHVRRKTVPDIRRGEGCRDCYGRQGESVVRSIFEKLFGVAFPLSRPLWLKSAQGNRLELDGYAPSLGLAFEYQGFSHRISVNYAGFMPLAGVQERDKFKAQVCAAYGVHLVQIPEIPGVEVAADGEILERVFSALREAGVTIDERTASEIRLERTPRSKVSLERLRNIGRVLGLRLLSDEYLGTDYRYHWLCEHCKKMFRGNAYYRNKGRGCPLCWRKRKALSRESER